MEVSRHREFHGPHFFLRYYGEPIAEFFRNRGPLFRRERAKKRWMLQLLQRYVPRGRLLDVGAGQALFDYLAREHGYQVQLVEICPPVVEYHRSQGFEVHEGYLEEARFPDGHFDAVTMWHTLEHMFDPLNTLQEVRRILKPGGFLVGALPNWRGLGTQLRLALNHPLLDPATDHELHFSFFSIRALERAFRRAGLQPVSIGPEWHRPRRLRDRMVHRLGQLLSLLPGVNCRESIFFAAHRRADEGSGGRP